MEIIKEEDQPPGNLNKKWIQDQFLDWFFYTKQELTKK